MRSSLDMGPVRGKMGPRETVAYLPTCNLAVDRGTLRRLGGFDEQMDLVEDADLIWRALSAGSGVYYEPDAGIRHNHRTRLMALLRRRADYGSSEADLQQRHEEARRTTMVPVVGTTWLTALTMLPVAWPVSLGLALFGALAFCVELISKRRQLREASVQLPARSILTAISRQHRAGLYHLGANVTRYYSLPLLAASLFWPPLLPPVFVLLLLPPVVDHRRLRPKLGLITFVCLYSLELMAYQVGVWRGCLRRRTLRPLLTKLRFSR